MTCKLSIDINCVKYHIKCYGSDEDKEKCPDWNKILNEIK